MEFNQISTHSGLENVANSDIINSYKDEINDKDKWEAVLKVSRSGVYYLQHLKSHSSHPVGATKFYFRLKKIEK